MRGRNEMQCTIRKFNLLVMTVGQVEEAFNEVFSKLDGNVFSIETLNINNAVWLIIFTKEEMNNDR
jgi:hypothetical protein